MIECSPDIEQQKRTDDHFDAASSYWNDIYEARDVDAAIYRDRRAAVLELVRKLAVPTDRPVLELGCGAGLVSVALAKAGYTVQATDSVEAMIRQARQRADESGVGDRVITGICDVHNLDFPDNSFDLILKIGVAPWLHSLDKAVREVSRVLRPGGYLITTADSYWRLNFWLDPRYFPPFGSVRKAVRGAMEKMSLRKPSGPGAQLHTKKQFDASLIAAGLQKIDWRTVGFGPFSLLGKQILPDPAGVALHNWLQGLADRNVPVIRSAGTHYIVLARKGASSQESKG